MAKYDFYTNRSISTPAKIANNNFRLKLWGLAQKILPANASICEIGAGTGELAQIISQEKHDYICYEESECNVEYLKSLNLKVVKARVPPIQSKDKTYDLVIASHVLEHCSGPNEAEAMLNEINRVLKDNACFLVAVPNILEAQGYFYDFDWTHQYPTSPFRLKRLLQDCGFELEKDCHIYLGFKGYLGRLIRFPLLCSFKIAMLVLPDSNKYSEKMIKARMLITDNYCALYRKK